MGSGLAGFGEAFANAYIGTSNMLESKRRGDILQAGEKRAQQEFDLKQSEHKEIVDLTNDIAGTVQKRTNDMHDWVRESQQAVPQPGLQPPDAGAPAQPGATPALAAGAEPGAAPAITGPAAAAPARRAAPTLADHINNGRELTREITPKLIKVLMKTNPVEAAKLAQGMANEGVQDRMAKTAALGTLIKANSFDPAIQQLLPDVIPNYVPGSYLPHKPDPDGNNGYGQMTVKLSDGSTKEVAINPASVDSLLVSTLSPAGQLEDARAAVKSKREGLDTASQIARREAQTTGEAATLAETKRHREVEEPLRAAQVAAQTAIAQSHAASAKLANEQRAGMLEERTATRLGKESTAGNAAIFSLYGITPQMMAADEDGAIKNRVLPVIAATQGIAGENQIPYSATSAPRLAAVVNELKQGTPKLYRDPKTNQFVYDTGDPKNPLRFSPTLMQTIMGGSGKGLTPP